MSSRYGASHGLPGYDEFRTGLTFSQVKDMMKDNSDDPKDWKYKRRGTVLGFWHKLKRDMYEEACGRGYLDTLKKRKAHPALEQHVEQIRRGGSYRPLFDQLRAVDESTSKEAP